MYIPTSFFSSQGSCFTITTSTITGSGNITSGSFVSGGYVWDYYSFNNTSNQYATSASFSASFNVLSGSTGQAKILIVGAGGGGGYNPGDSCINPYIDTGGSAGGAGGGGVVYYNQFPLSSGSYEVVVGTGGLGGQDLSTPSRIGATGGRSYFKNKDFDYSPFTSSFLVAYGGGGGAGCANNCGGAGIGIGASGASSGGGAQTNVASTGVPQVQPLNVFGGVPAVNQGNRSGAITINPYGNDRAMGGGGAGTSSADITDIYNPFAGSPGGDGIPYNVTGTLTYYGAGGGGVRWANIGLGTLTGNGTGWGNPGSGGTGGFGGRFGNIRGAEPGTNGVVIIAIQKCLSAFSCKNFAITGSNGTLSYLNCGFPFVTSSKLSSNQDQFTACLLTYSGSNTPVLLTGTTTSSVISDCSAQFTSSAGCNCTYIRAVPTSGTQTITLWPCNGSGSVTQSVPPAGRFFCIENYSPYSFPSGAVTEYGTCQTGSCTGINYTSSFVNCSSMLATAGPSGGTLTWLPCGSGSVIQLALSASESRSICAAYTASLLSITGAGSSFTNYSSCSYQFPNILIQNCSSSVTQSVTIAGSATYVPNVGNIFTSTTTGLTGSCWNVIGTTTQSVDYSNIVVSEQFADCPSCLSLLNSIELQYLVVGGGGLGGYVSQGGGGGGGGFVTGSARLLATQTYPVVVGNGAIGGGVFAAGTSSFWTSSALGGGNGGQGSSTFENGYSGSSGGGGGAWVSTRGAGGLGTAGQGFNGGSGSFAAGNNIYAGGGGGAGAPGADGSTTSNGGAGKAWLDGNYYAGGGGGARYIYNASLGLGGIGGGGRGAGRQNNANPPTSGSPNTGGGGGGNANYDPPSYGGSGVVKIRYAGSGSRATGGTISFSGSYTYHTFTASGDFIIP